MPSSYSSLLRLEKQATGENQGTWGTKLNTVIDLVDAAIAGKTEIATTGGNTTLTTNNGSSDQARPHAILLTGALESNAVIIIPNLSKSYIVRNSCTENFTVSIKTSSGSAVILTPGITHVYCDGANVVTRVAQNAGKILLEEGSVTAVSSKVFLLAKYFPYSKFILQLHNTLQASENGLHIQVSDNGGSGFSTGPNDYTYQYVRRAIDDGASDIPDWDHIANSLATGLYIDAQAGEEGSFENSAYSETEIEFFDPTSGRPKMIKWSQSRFNNGMVFLTDGNGVWRSTSAYDAFRVATFDGESDLDTDYKLFGVP